MDKTVLIIIVGVVALDLLLSLLPAGLAKGKGHSFFAWWILSSLLGFLLGLLIVACLSDKRKNVYIVENNISSNNVPSTGTAGIDAAEELKKYKSLLDEGVITQEEFDKKKQSLLSYV